MRVLQVGLGPLGIRLVEDLVEREFGQLVGAFDVAPALVGKPLAELVPGAATDLVIQSELATFERWDEVDIAFLTTSSDLSACMETLRILLDRGVSVVSSCEELLYPWLRHPIHAQELHQRAVRNKAGVVGTGINPGFLMDTLPLALTAVSKSVERIDAWRIQDASPRRIPFQKKIGATLDQDAFQAAVDAGNLRHVGLGESLHFIAHYLGWKLDDWTETIAPVLASRDLECGVGPIPKGHASGVLQVAQGYEDGVCRLRLEFQAAIGQDAPHDRVRVQGEPPLDVRIEGGVHGDIATIAMLLNTVASLKRAEPGLHTMATLAPAHFRRARASS